MLQPSAIKAFPTRNVGSLFTDSSTMADEHTPVSKFSSTLTYLFSMVDDSISKHFPKFSIPLCQTHNVCWCEECLLYYQTTGFTKFRNSCDHFEAQCLEASFSPLRINQLQLILKYADHLEATVEEEIIRRLDSAEGDVTKEEPASYDVTGR